LADAYEKLMSLVGGDHRKQLTEAQHAWIDLQKADAELERSIPSHMADSNKELRSCARAEQLERYSLVIEQLDARKPIPR